MTDHGLQSHHKVVGYHRETGAHEMFPLDANDAVQRHPDVWSLKPWKRGQDEHGKAKRLPAGGTHYEEPTQ